MEEEKERMQKEEGEGDPLLHWEPGPPWAGESKARGKDRPVQDRMQWANAGLSACSFALLWFVKCGALCSLYLYAYTGWGVGAE